MIYLMKKCCFKKRQLLIQKKRIKLKIKLVNKKEEESKKIKQTLILEKNKERINNRRIMLNKKMQKRKEMIKKAIDSKTNPNTKRKLLTPISSSIK